MLFRSNPVVLLNTISYDRMVELTKDEKFMKQLNETYAEFRAYMDAPKDKKKPTIAYFSMEYGLTHVLKIYSGGLGILAGVEQKASGHVLNLEYLVSYHCDASEYQRHCADILDFLVWVHDLTGWLQQPRPVWQQSRS